MECNNRNKRKFQCGQKVSSACTEYAGWLPNWSDLRLEDCVTVEEVLEEQYHVLDKILKAINVSDLGRGCIEYPSSPDKLTVAMILAAFEDRLCNTVGYKTRVYTNEEVSLKAVKTDVPSGFVGSEETYVVPAGSHVSAKSQEDANALAINDARAHVQAYANEVGSYTPRIYYNSTKSKDFVKNDCPGDMPCGAVTYTVNAGSFTSTISQEEADALAQRHIDQNGQLYANENGKCKQVYFSQYISEQFYKNDCDEGFGDPTGILYELKAGAIVSEVSQYDADSRAMSKAREEGQKMANEFGVCSRRYLNQKMEMYFERGDCDEGYKGKSKLYTLDAGEVESYISQEDANSKARKLLRDRGNSLIKIEGECIENYHSIKSYVYPSGTAEVNHPESSLEGSYVSFDIVPKDDFGVDYVTINGDRFDDLADNEGSFYLEKPTVIKIFMKSDIKYDVKVSANPENGGIVSILTGNKEYTSGSSCIIEAIPNDGYDFDGWYRNGIFVSYSKNYPFIVDKNTNGEYVAIFNKNS